MIFALDPGTKNGAAVLVEGDEDRGLAVVAAARWKGKPKVDPLDVWWWTTREPRGRRVAGVVSAYRVGLLVSAAFRPVAGGAWSLVVEDTYVGPSAGNALRAARWSGAAAGPCEEGATGPTTWIKPAEWRRVMGLSIVTKRDRAKALTAALLPGNLRESVVVAAKHVGGLEHVTDAAGIAWWFSRRG